MQQQGRQRQKPIRIVSSEHFLDHSDHDGGGGAIDASDNDDDDDDDDDSFVLRSRNRKLDLANEKISNLEKELAVITHRYEELCLTLSTPQEGSDVGSWRESDDVDSLFDALLSKFVILNEEKLGLEHELAEAEEEIEDLEEEIQTLQFKMEKLRSGQISTPRVRFADSENEELTILRRSNELLTAEAEQLTQQIQSLLQQIQTIKQEEVKASDSSKSSPSSSSGALQFPANSCVSEELYSIGRFILSIMCADCGIEETGAELRLDTSSSFEVRDRIGDAIDSNRFLAIANELHTSLTEFEQCKQSSPRHTAQEKRVNPRNPDISNQSKPTSKSKWSLWRSKEDSTSSSLSSPSSLVKERILAAMGQTKANASDSKQSVDYAASLMKVLSCVRQCMNYMSCRLQQPSAAAAVVVAAVAGNSQSISAAAETGAAAAATAVLTTSSNAASELDKLKAMYKTLESELCRVKFLLALCQEKLDDKIVEAATLNRLLTSYVMDPMDIKLTK